MESKSLLRIPYEENKDLFIQVYLAKIIHLTHYSANYKLPDIRKIGCFFSEKQQDIGVLNSFEC